jgi:hypothetical protein
VLKEVKSHSLRILDFDIENMPLSYNGQDFTTAQITAIAASWADKKRVHCWVLGEVTYREMIENFLELYDQADIVTGHYIKKHDLPIINSACLELGLEPLSEKVAQDTLLDLTRRRDFSGSQESLAGMLGMKEAKHHMSQHDWRISNRIWEDGPSLTRKRVTDDVIQHKAMRAKLVKQGVLKPPKIWTP